MKVDTKHAEYIANEANWRMLRDFLQGEDAVKAARDHYLPKPAGRDDSEFEKYVERATFFDATAKTVTAMAGAMFRKEPTITLPTAIEYLKDDADGKGTPLAQVAKRAAVEAVGLGRVGLLVDFPVLDEAPKSRKDEIDLKARAQVYQYNAEDIINWRYQKVGAAMRLVLLVLKECHETIDPADPFVTSSEDQYRVLRLDAGLLTVELWRERRNAETKAVEWYVAQTAFPRLPGDKPLDFIPFVFLGSQDLTAAVDKSPVLDIARINRAHYRNSADYEDGLFMLGQPTPWITGLSQQYIDKHSGALVIGSRSAWLLPENAECGLLEMSNNMAALKEAMAEKKEQMAQLGARLFDGKEGNPESAQASHMRQSGEASTLSSAASNVSRAFKQVLDWCSLWMGAAGEADFRTNDDFFATRLDAPTLAGLIAAWQGGAITLDTLLQQLVSGEIIADGTDLEEYKQQLEEDAANLPGAEGDPDEDELDPGDDPDADPSKGAA